MRLRTSAPLMAAATLALLAAACSKPAETAGDTASAAGDNASMAASGATAAGGAISPPPSDGQNDAVNTDTNKSQQDLAAGSNSFTEGQAKGHIENAGYTEVTGLTKTPDGMWTGKAKKDGATVDVAVDFKGAVTSK